MSAATTAASIPPIVEWFQVYGNIVFFFAQLLWWIVTGFAAGWAACIYYRYVKMQKALIEADLAAAADFEAQFAEDEADDKASKAKVDTKAKDVDVDKFVE